MAFLLQKFQENEKTIIENWYDCFLSETKKTGFVCTFSLLDKKHCFYGLNDLQKLIRASRRGLEDMYLSLNAFEYGYRKTGKLKQIRNIGIDIDCYKVGLPVPKVRERIIDLVYKGIIPNPNLVIFSGRGLQIIYSISGGASPTMAFLTQYITAQYISKLRNLGADTTTTDVTRVFRLPGSINSKNGKQVSVEIWNKIEYDLAELYEYCTPLENRRKSKKSKKSIKGKLVILNNEAGLRTFYSLNNARKNDLETLVALRNGNIEKRNVLTYIYSYTVSLILKNKQQTIDFALQLNEHFQDPQEKREVERTAGNAYDDAMEFFVEFKKRDFKMWYKAMDNIKKPMANRTIIESLDITSEEMKHMTTIIDAKEKRFRNTEYQQNKRRSQGILTREQYIKEHNNKLDDKLFKLHDLMQKKPNAKKSELARELGISRTHLYRLLNYL
ncbi:AsnC family protein [Anoxybacillus sp. TBDG-1]